MRTRGRLPVDTRATRAARSRPLGPSRRSEGSPGIQRASSLLKPARFFPGAPRRTEVACPAQAAEGIRGYVVRDADERRHAEEGGHQALLDAHF